MSDKKSKNGSHPNGSDESPGPDSSSDSLLRQMRRTYSDPEMPAITDEDVAAAIERDKTDEARDKNDTLPPYSSAEIRREQIKAWNAMAEAMIDVVKTIKTNEKKMDESDARRRRLIFLVVAAAIIAVFVNWRQGQTMIEQAAEHQQRVERNLEDSSKKQDKLMLAVAELAEAQAVGLEADADYDPDKGKIAKAEALEAQKLALEAKKEAQTDPEQKAKTERKIEKVEKAAEDAKADAPPAPFDD